MFEDYGIVDTAFEFAWEKSESGPGYIAHGRSSLRTVIRVGSLSAVRGNSLWLFTVLFLTIGLTESAWALPPAVRVSQEVSASSVSLQWQVNRSNWLSTVETRDDLSGGSWEPAPGTAWPSPVTNWSDLRPPSASGRFYRVIVASPMGHPGQLLSATWVENFSITQLDLLFQFAGAAISAKYAVGLYDVTYETVDPYGSTILASGAILVPIGHTNAAALVAYDHGTSIEKSDVPSEPNLEGILASAFAADGYIAVAPDYLGLGASPGFHPYLHAATEASATMDLLRAARQFCASNSFALNGQLFISGYSQGGHSALATLRALENSGTNEFSVTACGCGSGPYDLAGTSTQDILSGRVPPNPYYFLYLLAAYQDVYGLAPSLADLLAPPYDRTLPPLMDGLHSDAVVNAAMPTIPINILAPAELADFKTNATNPFRIALSENSLLNWTPKSPLRLYSCSGDEDVVPANSKAAYDSFQARGATQVQWQDPKPGATHDNCAIPALFSIKAWFDTLRK